MAAVASHSETVSKSKGEEIQILCYNLIKMPSIRFKPVLIPGVLTGLALGCSLDIMPVHFSKVNSAKLAEQPLLRGPDAPGAFDHAWKFPSSEGFLFDPSEIEISGGAVRLKKGSRKSRKSAVLITGSSTPYVALDSFLEVLGPSHKGKVVYQLSRDSASWYYHNGKEWVLAGPSAGVANSAAEVNQHIPRFHLEAGTGTLYLKIFLISPTGEESVELKQVNVRGVAPRMDGWD